MLVQDLTVLREHFVFACNQSYHYDWPFEPDFYAINSRKRFSIEPATQAFPNTAKFLVKKVEPSYELPPRWTWILGKYEYLMGDRGFEGLGDELGVLPMGTSSPLTFAQIAAWMGFTSFYMLGQEQTRSGHVYATSGPLAGRLTEGGRGRELTEKEWVQTEQRTFDAYARARKDIEAAGREMFDCTPGGRLSADGILEYRDIKDLPWPRTARREMTRGTV